MGVVGQHVTSVNTGLSIRVLGTFSNDDDDGSENVAKKMNLRSFKLNRVHLDPLNMSNAGNFSWSWILKDFIQVQKRKKNSSSYVHFLALFRRFHVAVQSCIGRKRNVLKSVTQVQSCCFAHKTNCFLKLSLWSSS